VLTARAGSLALTSDTHRLMIFVDELNGGAKAASTVESGARTVKVMDAILADYRRSHPV